MKNFLSLSLVCATLFGATDAEIERFLQNNYKKNQGVSVKSFKILGKEKMQNGYEAVRYFVDLSIINTPGGVSQTVKMSDIIFAKDNIIAPELFDATNGKNFKDEARPKLPQSAYKDSNFVAGNKNAKNKIVIFSDPFCPFCRDILPDLIAMAEKNPTKVALWHYGFPLTNIHPAAVVAIKAEIALETKMPNKEILTKLYKLDINPQETDEGKILTAINKAFNVKLTPKDLNSKNVLDKYNSETDFGYQMIIKGTPTLYVNGDFDASLAKTQALMKESGK